VKHIFAAAAFIALVYFVFFSDASRAAWNGRCGNHRCGDPVTTQERQVTLPSSDHATVTCKSGACRRMSDSEVTSCWARGAAKIFREHHTTSELGSEFAIDCPEGRVIGVFEVHSNAAKGVSLFRPLN
jgi:hypothetical protein